MLPGHVAYGLAAQYGLRISTATVLAWERGHAVPTGHELTALAGVLWCSPGELLTAARTLREHRTARRLTVEELAGQVGLAPAAYLRMEESGRWRGNERQSAALAEALGLTAAGLVTVSGRDEELAELLRAAVTTRRQAPVRAVAKLVRLERGLLQDVLDQLHADYRAPTSSAPGRTGAVGEPPREPSGATDDAERAFLAGIVERFWRTADMRDKGV
ncbi:helix-turn-helix domain-containing protein [Streptomyces sp. NPDC014744]|uniref:helix-turn-helix domain-containing protein n=1 Tax=Streptomyces sp. NPDC014744 TaxID=3364903 RepID=UPI0036FE489F